MVLVPALHSIGVSEASQLRKDSGCEGFVREVLVTPLSRIRARWSISATSASRLGPIFKPLPQASNSGITPIV
jgi:hypothetical protein